MRIKLEITPEETFSSYSVSHYNIVGFIWNVIQNSGFGMIHRRAKYRPFTFSEVFPFGDYYEGKKKNIIISSPYSEIVEAIYESYRRPRKQKIGKYSVTVSAGKPFEVPVRNIWVSGSPIVIRKKGKEYWSVKKNSLNDFLEHIERNAKNKLKYFLGIEKTLDLFQGATFLKEVAISFRKGGSKVLIVGSKWILHLNKNWQDARQTYKFLMDIGLGEKNGMGFGFVNPVRR